jgi:hypothetical protein
VAVGSWQTPNGLKAGLEDRALQAEATMDSGYCYELQFMGRSPETGKITTPKTAPSHGLPTATWPVLP